MAFFIVTGTMGGGKTYYGVEVILQALREGAIVHTNIDLRHDEIEKMGFASQVVTLENDPSSWKRQLVAGEEGRENLVVIDEATIMFHVHSAQKGRESNGDVFELLRWSRKLGLDVFMISQSAENIDPALRRMCMQVVDCVNTSTLPLVGWFLPRVLGQFRRTSFSQRGSQLYQSFHRFNATVGAMYKTDATCGREMGLSKNVTRKKKLRTDQLYGQIIGLVAVGVVIYLVVAGWAFYKDLFGIKSTMSKYGLAAKEKVEASKKGAPAAGAPAKEDKREFYHAVTRSGSLVIWGTGGRRYAVGASVGGLVVESIMAGKSSAWVSFADGTKKQIFSNSEKGSDKWKNGKQSQKSGRGPLASALPLGSRGNSSGGR